MRQAIGFFLNLLVLVLLLKMFAPGLADQLIDILGKMLALMSQLLDAVLEQSRQGQLVGMLALV